MQQRGKFIVLEGADGSGKSTQTLLLRDALEKAGHKVILLDFPRYEESYFGALVKRFLKGELGSFEKTSPYFTVLPYMIDQALMGPKIKEWLDQGLYVLSDRYFTSNFGHQVSKFPNGPKRDEMRKWLFDAGYGELGIVKQDLVLVCDVPPKVSATLMEGRSHKVDIADKNKKHQRESYKEFIHMTEAYPDWIRVQCTQGNKMLSPSQIHEQIIMILGI